MPSQRLLTLILFGSVILLGLSYVQKRKLPEKSALLPGLQQEPLQGPTEERPFDFDYKGVRYHVTPVASYELRGLVVSHNNISSVADIYHDKSSLDTKDILVLWGRNLSSDYRNIKFWNGCWTGYWQPKRYGMDFFSNCISNNHLITSNERIRRRIAGINVGDQVLVKGMLVNYCRADLPQCERKTSTKRDDTWNGACEVIYVTDIETLKPNNPWWYRIFRLTRYLVPAVLIARIVLFFL